VNGFGEIAGDGDGDGVTNQISLNNDRSWYRNRSRETQVPSLNSLLRAGAFLSVSSREGTPVHFHRPAGNRNPSSILKAILDEASHVTQDGGIRELEEPTESQNNEMSMF